jgi:hypothetical protein
MLILIIFIGQAAIISRTTTASDQIPTGLTLYAEGDGSFGLYWFCRDLHDISWGNVSDAPVHWGCLSTGHGKNLVLTRMNICPPVYIDSVSTFISDGDVFPNLPGDQFSPIVLSLKKKSSDGVFHDCWCRSVALDSNSLIGGEITSAAVDHVITREFEIWAALEWMPETPASPLIGINTGARGLEQYYYKVSDSGYRLIETPEEFMIGIKMLRWRDKEAESFRPADDNLPRYFEVIYGRDTVDLVSSGRIIDSLGSDQLFCRFRLDSGGYVGVALVDTGGRFLSRPIYVEPVRLPPIKVLPDESDTSLTPGQKDLKFIRVLNTGLEEMSIRIVFDSALLFLSEDTLTISPGTYFDIRVEPRVWLPPDTILNSAIILYISDYYYPVLYRIRLRQSDPTEVSENIESPCGIISVGPAYPNPFNSSVAFDLYSSSSDIVLFEVYNLLGQRLYSRKISATGRQKVLWPESDAYIGRFPTGMYFFGFSWGHGRTFKKALLVK